MDYMEIIEDNGYIFVKEIGGGGFGLVAEVMKNGRIYALKLILPTKDKKIKEELVREFRGRNIVKIIQEKKKETNKKKYYLYVMEPSFIGSLQKFNDYLDANLIFKDVFIEKLGDNLMRFMVLQLVNAFRTFYQGNLVHFDIKPDNILIFKGLELKVIDFSFLTKLSPDKKERIPGGTFGYTTPEFYRYNDYDNESLKKQDYFALGMTIFFLKYGHHAIKTNKRDKKDDKNNDINVNIISESIEIARNLIKNRKYQDKDFSEFLLNLIQFKPKERLDFESIKRNKWLNKNKQILRKILNINLSDEDNILLELQKSDFLINNVKYYRKENFDKRYNNENENKSYRQIRKGKFKFFKRNHYN